MSSLFIDIYLKKSMIIEYTQKEDTTCFCVCVRSTVNIVLSGKGLNMRAWYTNVINDQGGVNHEYSVYIYSRAAGKNTITKIATINNKTTLEEIKARLPKKEGEEVSLFIVDKKDPNVIYISRKIITIGISLM